MASNGEAAFASNYLVLDPKDATAFDLLRFLLSSRADNRRFIFAPRGTRLPFPKRVVIVGSVVLQLILFMLAGPLALLGYALEQWLNLLHVNGGFMGLIFRILRGRRPVQAPDRDSPKFLSLIGLSDNREELDASIPIDDTRYNSALAIMAAKVVYENPAHIEDVVSKIWKMEFMGFYDFWNAFQRKPTTQAMLFRQNKDSDSELICVAFRGTEPFAAEDWITDMDLSYFELPKVGRAHSGFMEALGLQRGSGWPKDLPQSTRQYAYYTIREILKDALKNNPKAKFIVTGHSLGGALAILFPSILAYHEEKDLLDRLDGVYTFGQPRVADSRFGAFVEQNLEGSTRKYFRIVYCNDLVPRVPWDNSWSDFQHFGKCIYFNSLYRGDIVDEVPNKNYFSIFMFIPKKMISAWELIRGFGMGMFMGPEYKELKVMRAVRLMGLFGLAGLPAHAPLDYVNSTRFASPNLYTSKPWLGQ
ncbi:unnamed protein product [Coffea canephora]|uniref:Fungal lipase-type domain-containing protein n=1 Tax=Coffea canephora TaxID=49390 RepID=A0A068U2V9_COFCA|nr:unnamed protein product [Coffea canephora]